MSEHQDDREDMLATMERIAEEDDVSFDVEIARGESVEGPSSTGTESGPYYAQAESMGTDGSAASEFVMEEEEEEEYERYPREGSFDDSQSTDDRASSMPFARRGSSRRSSFVSTDSGATSLSGNNSPRASPTIEQQKSSSDFRPRRRQSINLTSIHHSAVLNDEARSGAKSKKAKKTLRPMSRLSKLGPSARRAGKMDEDFPNSTQPHSALMTVGQMGNSQLEDAAAAAAVVALSTGAAVSSKKRIQYVVDDYALVFLNILNHTNSVDPPEAFTVTPVNKYGFPPGEGHHSKEQEGPYVYVMALVKRVHFDEDVPYYTVARADTGAEQRADVRKSCRTNDYIYSTVWSILTLFTLVV